MSHVSGVAGGLRGVTWARGSGFVFGRDGCVVGGVLGMPEDEPEINRRCSGDLLAEFPQVRP